MTAILIFEDRRELPEAEPCAECHTYIVARNEPDCCENQAH